MNPRNLNMRLGLAMALMGGLSEAAQGTPEADKEADEELERHEFWMVRTLSDDGILVLGEFVAREWKKAGLKVECWPCDQHGNKTRRGA